MCIAIPGFNGAGDTTLTTVGLNIQVCTSSLLESTMFVTKVTGHTKE